MDLLHFKLKRLIYQNKKLKAIAITTVQSLARLNKSARLAWLYANVKDLSASLG
jgi:hypothetical protein